MAQLRKVIITVAARRIYWNLTGPEREEVREHMERVAGWGADSPLPYRRTTQSERFRLHYEMSENRVLLQAITRSM